MMDVLSSLQNPRVKQIVKWRDRRDRDRDQKVLIEGYRALVRALEGAYPIEELYICPELYQGVNEPALVERCVAQGARLFQVTSAAFAKMSYRDRPEGLLGIGTQRHTGLEALLPLKSPAFFLVAEQIEKPGNLGTMLRSSDAAGVDALILCDARTDLYNPNVVRASTGNLFTQVIAEATTADAIAWLKGHGVAIVASTPHTDLLYTAADFTGPVALVMGAEEFGLSPQWLEAADCRVRLPMMGAADSLNVATATALLLYEVLRQRMDAGIVVDTGAVPDARDC